MADPVEVMARIGLSVVCGAISLTCLRFAWEIVRYRPTQAEIAAEHGRRKLAKLFRAMLSAAQVKP